MYSPLTHSKAQFKSSILETEGAEQNWCTGTKSAMEKAGKKQEQTMLYDTQQL